MMVSEFASLAPLLASGIASVSDAVTQAGLIQKEASSRTKKIYMCIKNVHSLGK